jgi:MoxR-like ATPase
VTEKTASNNISNQLHMTIQLPRTVEDSYIPSPELLAAINTALFLKRPLLISGEPGTGKTECAAFLARQLHRLYPDKFALPTAMRFNTKSVSQSSDLFYQYDAVAHFGDKENKPKEAFVSLNALGTAILATHPQKQEWTSFNNYSTDVIRRQPPTGSVVLIDEIDKAPRDFPNDLLSELEKPPFKFSVRELVHANFVQNPEYPILVIITSNNEKGLPDAFLRRCVFHFIRFPEESLLSIVTANLKAENQYIETAIARFLELRKSNISKKPATSELIDWIACLQHKDLLNEKLTQWKEAEPEYREQVKTTLGILAKSKPDYDTISQTLA